MSKPAVLGPSMIIPRRRARVQLERATVPCRLARKVIAEKRGISELNSTSPAELCNWEGEGPGFITVTCAGHFNP